MGAQVERQAREVAGVLEAAEGFSRLHMAQRGITARKVPPTSEQITCFCACSLVKEHLCTRLTRA